MTERSGPEKYAPVNRRPLQRLGEIDPAVANAVEGEIRQIIRRDIAELQRTPSEFSPESRPVEPHQIHVQRLANESLQEIAHVINELESVREMLRSEGERVSREIDGYASLNQAAKTAMQVIIDGIRQWKGAHGKAK